MCTIQIYTRPWSNSRVHSMVPHGEDVLDGRDIFVEILAKLFKRNYLTLFQPLLDSVLVVAETTNPNIGCLGIKIVAFIEIHQSIHNVLYFLSPAIAEHIVGRPNNIRGYFFPSSVNHKEHEHRRNPTFHLLGNKYLFVAQCHKL
jgi:hypothetical protein